MFRQFQTVKALKTLIKLAAVALTSPATVAVASGLYPDSRITSFIVSIAALILVEGCLLLGWQMLDQEGKHATPAQRWLYAALAWVAYFSLFGIALYHNEGIAGLVFRLTLGVMLVYASAEAGLLATIRTQDQADRDIQKDWRVRRYSRKLARQNAMADLDMGVRLRHLDRSAEIELYTLRRQHETEREIEQIEKGRPPDSEKPVDLPKSDRLLDAANARRSQGKQAAMDRTLQLLDAQPGITPSEIAREIGRSRQTVHGYLKELGRENSARENGNS